jgi:hypothetical protein
MSCPATWPPRCAGPPPNGEMKIDFSMIGSFCRMRHPVHTCGKSQWGERHTQPVAVKGERRHGRGGRGGGDKRAAAVAACEAGNGGISWRRSVPPWSCPKTHKWSAPPLRSKYGHVLRMYSAASPWTLTPVGSRSRKPQFICRAGGAARRRRRWASGRRGVGAGSSAVECHTR